MTHRHITKARRALQNAGTPKDRDELRSRLADELNNDLETLDEEESGVRDDFRRRLARWRTEDVPADTPIHAIPSDISDARLYRITGVFALLCEVALASWVFAYLGVPWIIGALAALAITVTLHGVFLQVFDNPERPKEAVWRLKVYVLAPAIIGFLVALALGILARYVTGGLAVALLPLFSLSLWLGTISLMLLAGGLFTLAHLRGWSQKHQRVYRAIDRERRQSTDFLAELERDTERRALPEPERREITKSIAAAVILAALIPASGCIEAASSPTLPARNANEAALDIYIDWSGSCVRPALEEALAMVVQELPDVIEQNAIGELALYRFAEDGWSPELLETLTLPAKPTIEALPNTEWASFKNIRDALEESEAQALAQRAGTYRAQLREVLQPLKNKTLLPDEGTESNATDVAGLFARIASTADDKARIILVLTDLADTKHKTLPTFDTPGQNTRTLVLVTPAKPKDARRTFGKALSSRDQYIRRAEELANAAPWAHPAPYFTKDLARLLE